MAETNISIADQMQDLCVSAATKPAKAQAQAWLVPRVFHAVCIAGHAEMQTQLPGLQATSELDHHPAGNKAQAEGLEVCTDNAGWRELVQP